MTNESKKGSKVLKFACIGFFALEIIAILVFTIELVRFPILPTKYMVLYACLMVLAVIITGMVLLDGRGNKRHYFGMVIAALIAIALFIGFYYVDTTRKTLESITTDPVEQEEEVNKVKLSIMVLKDDPAKTIDDIAGYKFGFQLEQDLDKTLSMIEFMNNKYGKSIDTKAYDYYSELATGLLEGQVQAILVDSIYVDIIEMYEEGFADKTRLLTEVEFPNKPSSITITPSAFPTSEPTEGPTEEPSPEPSLEPGTTATPTTEVTPGPTSTPKPRPTYPPVVQEFYMPERSDGRDLTKSYFTVYFSGIDVYGAINQRSRSDVNIVMTVNPTTKKILLVTIPRDAYTPFPGITGGQFDKLTHAGLYGVNVSMNTLNQIYGIKIDYYVRVNFTSIIRFVDAVGGVDVNVPIAFSVGGYSFKQGINHMNGTQALVFARERHSFAGGDKQRGRDQLEIIKAVINKMASSTTLLTNFGDIMNAVKGTFQTNIAMDQLTSLVRMQLDDGAKWSIDTYDVQVKGSTEWCYSYKGKKLSVGFINKDSAATATKKMRAVMEGK